MKIVDLKQRTPEWHAWRGAGVTASEAAVLMGSPYKTPWRLWAEKRGLVLPADLSGNPHVQRGIREEPLARRRYEERHGVLLLPMCAESSEEPILRASFDGITDEGIPVELKAPSSAKFRAAQAQGIDSELYQRYYAQVQTQIYVSEADRGILSLHLGEEFVDLDVPRNDAYLAQLRETTRAFWECMQTGREPPLDPERDLYVPKGAELETWRRLAADYRQLEEKRLPYAAELKLIEKKMVELEQQFLRCMGEFTLAESSGVRISRYLKRGAIDYKAALQHLQPDVLETELELFRRKATEQLRLTLRDEEGPSTEVPFDAEVLKRTAGLDYWF